MTSTVVVGGFFGDEGKGKIISYLAMKDNPKIIVRGGAGPNAGHTIRDGDKIYKVRMLPSGFLNKNANVMIGPGVVINPTVLLKEIHDFDASGRSFIDKHCGIIEESHLTRDSKGELKEKIGSTGSGTCADVGLGPKKVDEVIVVFKSYVTRVGTGPLAKELTLAEAESKGWSEFGTVTGRQRRAADFDFDLARRAIMLNSAT